MSNDPRAVPEEPPRLLYRRPLAGVDQPAASPTSAVPVVTVVDPVSSSTTSTSVPSTTSTPTTTTPSSSSTTSVPQVDSWRLAGQPSSIAGCQLFDRTSVFHSVVSGLPVHSRSAEWIGHLGSEEPLAVGMSSSIWQGSRPGIPVNVVDSRQVAWQPVAYDPAVYPMESWLTPLPIPSGMRIEGDPSPAWDQHALIVDSATCASYELFYYQPLYLQLFGVHWATAAAQWDLGEGGALVPQNGTTVSGIPLLAGMVRLAEVQAGRIDHLISACSGATGPTSTWPALRSDGTDSSPSAIPVGSRIRLKASVDLSGFTGQSRVVAQAMAVHGLMIGDTCFHPLAISGENVAAGWNESELAQLGALRVGDFEVVDASPMMISESSWQVR